MNERKSSGWESTSAISLSKMSAEAPIVLSSFVTLLQEFSGCFTPPSMTSLVTLMAGWVLDPLVDYVASAA
jgi:hypothetical protein